MYPQAIQRRLNEIEATLRELEAEGMKVELALRNQSSEWRGRDTLGYPSALALCSAPSHP